MSNAAVENIKQLLEKDPASQLLGIDIVDASADGCCLKMSVRDDMTNGYDVCYGGFIFSLADTALAFACAAGGEMGVTASAQIEFLQPAKLGDELIASASIAQRNGRKCFCDVAVSNQRDEVIALVRGRQAFVKQ